MVLEMYTPQPPARWARTLCLNLLGALSLAAGLVAFAPTGATPAGAAPLTSTFCASSGGAIPDDDTSGGRLLTIAVSGVPADVTDVDVRLLGLSETVADDLDAFVAAPSGTYSYLVSDVGGNNAIASIDVELDDEAAGEIANGSGFVAGTFRPSNHDNNENSAHFDFPTGFVTGPEAALSALDASTAIGTWRIWLADDDSAGTGGSITGACIDLTSANSVPTAGPVGALTTPEDTALAITLPGSDADAIDSLTYSITTQPAQGTITQVSGANWTYAPPIDFNNPDPAPILSFTYQVFDGTDSATSGGTIRVTPVNDAPVAPDQSVSTPEDAPLGITLSSTDVDGPGATFTITDAPDHGVLSGSGAARSFQPGTNYVGPDSFSFQVEDGAGGSDLATVSINVTPVNDAPTADDDSYDVSEDLELVVAAPGILLGDDDGDPELTQGLTAELLDDVTHGTLVLVADGSFTYQPDADFTGIDTFTYRADDGTLESATATVTIDVGGVNDAPTTTATRSVTTDEDTPLGITLTGDDPDGDTLTFEVTTAPEHGSFSGSGADLTYTPDPDYFGPDGFAFSVSDSIETATGTVTIGVLPVNDAPTGLDDGFTATEDVQLVVTAPGVLANDGDVEGDLLTVTLDDDVDHGTLALDADGSFTYQPDADFSGADTFTYVVTDGDAQDIATVTIDVDAVNDAPVAAADDAPGAFVVDEDNTLFVAAAGVLANDSDSDGDPLGAVLATPTAHGTISLAADGSFTYVPDPDFHGTDTFTYRVDDVLAEVAAAAVSPAVPVLITVVPVDDAPVAGDDAVITTAGTTVSIPVLGNDTDPDDDDDTLVVATHTAPGRGTVDCTTGSCTYTAPADDPGGAVTFDYVVEDPAGLTDTGTVTVTVLAAGQAPESSTATPTPAAEAPSVVAGAGASQLPRTGVNGSLWAYAALLLGLGLCTSGTSKLMRLVLRSPRRTTR